LPSPQMNAAAIYEPSGNRLLVFYGEDANGAILNEWWSLPLAGAPTWTKVGATPSRRTEHTAVYDDAHHVAVVFGGFVPDTIPGKIATDDTRVYGVGGGAQNWVPPAGGGPGSRSFAGAALDPVRHRMIVWGGERHGNVTYADLCALDSSGVWQALHAIPATVGAGVPATRNGHSAVYDPVCDRLVFFGGFDADSYTWSNEVWTLSLAGTPTWTHVVPAVGPLPAGRAFHSAVYDPLAHRMLVFGGQISGLETDELWSLRLDEPYGWTQLAPELPGPGARAFHSAIYNPFHREMVVFGGGRGSHRPFGGDLWTLPLEGALSWTEVTDAGSVPQRGRHTAVLDEAAGQMIVFGGGVDDTSIAGDTWSLALAGPKQWHDVMPTGGIAPRAAHVSVYDAHRDRVLVYGGDGTVSDEIWALAVPHATTGVQESAGPSLPIALAPAYPNPARDHVAFRLGSGHGEAILEIVDLGGRVVKRMPIAASATAATWDRRDAQGHRAPDGIYWGRMRGRGPSTSRSFVLVH
jgi:galactose oxidase-like protein